MVAPLEETLVAPLEERVLVQVQELGLGPPLDEMELTPLDGKALAHRSAGRADDRCGASCGVFVLQG